MAKKLFVGNLSHDIKNDDLKSLFESHGEVLSAQVIIDRDTGRSKGFGFVEMSNNEEAQEAIDALNGTEANGRELTVNEARPKRERSNGGPRRNGNGGGRRNNFGGGNRRY